MMKRPKADDVDREDDTESEEISLEKQISALKQELKGIKIDAEVMGEDAYVLAVELSPAMGEAILFTLRAVKVRRDIRKILYTISLDEMELLVDIVQRQYPVKAKVRKRKSISREETRRLLRQAATSARPRKAAKRKAKRTAE